MFKCEICGIAEFEREQQLRGHQVMCRKKYQAAEQQEPEVVFIPLSACPPELAYMRKGQQFLQVAGRVDRDRFVIEGTKVIR